MMIAFVACIRINKTFGAIILHLLHDFVTQRIMVKNVMI